MPDTAGIPVYPVRMNVENYCLWGDERSDEEKAVSYGDVHALPGQYYQWNIGVFYRFRHCSQCNYHRRCKDCGGGMADGGWETGTLSQ